MAAQQVVFAAIIAIAGAVFLVQVAADQVAADQVAADPQSCDLEIEIKHRGVKLNGQIASGSLYKRKPQTTTTTTTTTAKPGGKPKCVIPFQGDPDIYDWLQVLEETGGQPGKVNATKNKIEKSSEYVNPCERPLTAANHDEADKFYTYKQTDFKQVFRDEDAYLRFAGTKLEFVDVKGFVVWTPPKEAYDPRVYVADYRLDDTGLYLDVRKSNCTFDPSPRPSLYCKKLPICRCSEEEELRCKEDKVVSPNLMASLVG